MSAPRVLVVDDDASSRELLRIILQSAQFAVEEAYNAEEAIGLLRREPFDAVTLDIMMPEVDGLEVCRRIRSFSAVPILIISARDQLFDEIVGLEAGADDYITKPFLRESVIGRLRAALRRVEMDRKPTESQTSKSYGPIEIDLRSQGVRIYGQPYEFPGKEFDLLLALCENIGTLMSKERLGALVWDGDIETESKTLEVHIYRIRKKLDAAGHLGSYLETRRFRGYILSAAILEARQPANDLRN